MMYEAPVVPTFIGGAGRKRRLELAGQMGLLPPGSYCGSASVAAAGNGAKPAARPAALMSPRAASTPVRPAAKALAPKGPAVGVQWIQVAEDSPLVLQGLPELAPALGHTEDLKDLLSGSNNLTFDLAGESAAEIELKHDTEWAEYPEVGAAIKAAGGDDTPICIALHPSQGKWAVGMAGNWKKREQAARLALCVAMAANLEDFSALARTNPDFTRFCEASGIATDVDIGALAGAALAAPAAKKAKITPIASKPAASFVTDANKLPREKPLWILVEEEVPEDIALYMPEALAVCTDGNNRKGLFSCADRALQVLLADPSEVVYDDDCNVAKYTAVGKALKSYAPAEECICVAICPSKETWAVGIAMKGKARWSAAKAALATALMIKAEDEGTAPDMNEANAWAVGEFAAEARAAHQGA